MRYKDNVWVIEYKQNGSDNVYFVRDTLSGIVFTWDTRVEAREYSKMLKENGVDSKVRRLLPDFYPN